MQRIFNTYNMARPIAETPILFGEDAKRFVEAMQNVKPASAERITRIKEGYNRLKKYATFPC